MKNTLSLADLEASLSEVLLDEPIAFTPFEFGSPFLCISDVLLRVAQRKGEDPIKLEEMIKGKLPITYTVKHGYLYLHKGDEILIADQELRPSKVTIVLPPGADRRRILGAAAALPGNSCHHIQWRGAGEVVTEPEQVLELPTSPIAVQQFAEELQSLNGNIVVWLHPETFSHKDFQILYRSVLQPHPTLSLQCPEKRWCDIGALNNLGAHFSRSFALYCAGVTEGKDFDCAVPKLAERANLYWFAQSIAERNRLLSFGGISEFDLDWYECEARLGLYQRVKERGVLLGETRKWSVYVQGLFYGWVQAVNRKRIQGSPELPANYRKLFIGIDEVVKDVVQYRDAVI